jgi:hypothetical protein
MFYTINPNSKLFRSSETWESVPLPICPYSAESCIGPTDVVPGVKLPIFRQITLLKSAMPAVSKVLKKHVYLKGVSKQKHT